MLLNRVKVDTATTGTGQVTLGAAVAPYQTWAAAGATTGQTYSYLIEDGTAWEIGRGAYNGTGTLTRPGPGADSTFDSSTGALLALSGSATASCVANVLDYPGSGTGVQLPSTFSNSLPEAYGAALAQIAATTPANLPDGGKLDIVKNLGGLVLLGLMANTSNGTGSPVAGTSYTVPPGCVAVCYGGQGDDAVFNSTGSFYNHRLYNVTTAAVVAAWGGGSQSRGDGWAISKSGIFTNSAGGNPNNQSFPIVGVAGDVLETQAFTSGDGNYRVCSGVFFLAIVDATTGIPLPTTDNPLAGITALHLSADMAIGAAWTPAVGLTVDHDPLAAYPADTGVVTVPAGVNYARVTAQLAWDDKGGTRYFAVAAPGGISASSYNLIGHMSAAPNEGLQAATGAIVPVAPGQTYNFYAFSLNSGDHLTGSGSGNFGGPSRFLIEWFSAYPGAAG